MHSNFHFPPSLKLLTTLLCTSLFLEFLTHPHAILYHLQQPDGVETDVHPDPLQNWWVIPQSLLCSSPNIIPSSQGWFFRHPKTGWHVEYKELVPLPNWEQWWEAIPALEFPMVRSSLRLHSSPNYHSAQYQFFPSFPQGLMTRVLSNVLAMY